MAATLTQDRFTDGDWTFERKIDGIRLVAFKQGDEVRLYSRTRNPQHLPSIAAAIARLPVHDAILDGELPWEAGLDGFHVFDVGFQSQNSEAAKPMVYTTTLLLILIIVFLNLLAVWIRARLRRRFQGAAL